MTFPSLADCLGYFVTRSLYSYGQLAELAGLPRRTVANWMSGIVTHPRSWHGLLRVARALELDEVETNDLLRSAGFGPLASLHIDADDPEGRQLVGHWVQMQPMRPSQAAELPVNASLLRSYLATVASEMERLPVYFPSQLPSRSGRISQPIYVRVISSLHGGFGHLLQEEQPQPWTQLAPQFRRLIVIGPGGIGKTHLLRHEAARAAQRSLAAWPTGSDIEIPLFVRLADLASLLPDHPRVEDTLEAAARVAALQAPALPVESVEQLLAGLLKTPMFPLLILLDGWDEMRRANDLAPHLALALTHLRRLPAARLLLTSRSEVDYEPAAAATLAQAVVEVTPLGTLQVQRFIRSWFYGRRRLEWPLRIALRQSPELAQLAATPLMLTMLTNLAELEQVAPASKMELYDRLLRLMLEGRWRSHDLQLPETRVHAKLRLLQELAWRLATHRGVWHNRLPAAQLDAMIRQLPVAERLEATWLDTGGSVYGGVLWELSAWDNLLRGEVGSGPGADSALHYGFLHSAFHHFLVASYLIQCFEREGQNAPELQRLLAGPLLQPEWLEVLHLLVDQAYTYPDHAAGMLLSTILRTLLRAVQPLPTHLAVVVGEAAVAGFALEEASASTVIRTQLVEAMQQPQDSRRVRVYAGRVLAALGDPRLAVMNVDDIEWVKVPGGPFIVGSDAPAGASQEADDLPVQTVTLPTFWMARYLVTNAQYAQFLQEGYQNPAYWPEARTLGVWRAGQVLRSEPVSTSEGQLAFRSTWTSAPYRMYWPFDLPNHPANGLNWFEARAFARWLDARLRAAHRIPAGYRVDLPNELEWEKAARGSNGQVYPWGNAFAAERLNWLGVMLHGPTAVGCFPDGASPYGLLDMAGNMAEWTRTLYQPYDLDGRTIAQAESRVIMRGGGYYSPAYACRCASRGIAAAIGHLACSFRVALVPEGEDRE